MGSELKRRLLCARQGGRRRAEEAKRTREPSGESCRDRVAGADMFPPTLVFFTGGLSRAILLDFSWLRGWGVEWAGESWEKIEGFKKVSDGEKYTCLF